MSYSIADRDLGMDCDFEAKGETQDEVKQKMFEHAKSVHADIFATLDAEQQEEMSKKMDALIKQD